MDDNLSVVSYIWSPAVYFEKFQLTVIVLWKWKQLAYQVHTLYKWTPVREQKKIQSSAEVFWSGVCEHAVKPQSITLVREVVFCFLSDI